MVSTVDDGPGPGGRRVRLQPGPGVRPADLPPGAAAARRPGPTSTRAAGVPGRTPSTMRSRPMSAADENGEVLLTPAEVARLFRVDPKTVTRWAKAGKLSAIRTLGGHRRFRAAEVNAALHAEHGTLADEGPEPVPPAPRSTRRRTRLRVHSPVPGAACRRRQRGSAGARRRAISASSSRAGSNRHRGSARASGGVGLPGRLVVRGGSRPRGRGRASAFAGTSRCGASPARRTGR